MLFRKIINPRRTKNKCVVNLYEGRNVAALHGELHSTNYFYLQCQWEKEAFQISTTAIISMLCSPTPKTPPSNEAFPPNKEMAVSLQEDSCD